jgi:hypothetical protein
MFEEDLKPRLVNRTNFFIAVEVEKRAINLLTIRITRHIVGTSQSMGIMRCDDHFDLTFRDAVYSSQGVIELIKQ